MDSFDWNATPIRPLTREHVRAFLLEGCSEREISEVCRVSLSAVKRIAARAFSEPVPYGLDQQ